MEFLNKIEIRGIVGNSNIQKVGDTRLCRFSVVTELAYKGNDGTNIIESTRFSVSAFEGKDIQDLDTITRGAIVHVIGRLKCNRYVDANGNDRVQYEIVARKVDVEKEDRV
jgi:single-stranded DNA-binding protein